MAIPDYQTLMLPVLRLSAERPSQVREITEQISHHFGLSAEERRHELPSGKGVTVIHSRVGWAKTYLKQAGLIAQPRRGVVEATESGRALLATGITAISNTILERYPGFLAFKERSRPEADPADGTSATAIPAAPAPAIAAPALAAAPEELIDSAAAEHHAELRGDLLTRLRQSDPAFFERVVVDVMLAMGYGGTHRDAGQRLGRSGDGGVDGVISEDRLGLDRIYLQAKRLAAENTVGRPMVQAFVGALHGQSAHKGVFIATSSFSRDALDYVRGLGNMRVILIDGAMLAALMIDHDVGVRIQRTVTLKRLDLDYCEDDAA